MDAKNAQLSGLNGSQVQLRYQDMDPPSEWGYKPDLA